MEFTYQLMLYGGLAGALITLPIAIWLFIRLDILDVIQDLTGLRLKKHKSNQNSEIFQNWYKQEHTSSSIRLKKLHNTNESQSVQIAPVKKTDAETELLEEEGDVPVTLSNEANETELLAATTFLSDETELLEEENPAFIIEEDIVIGHNLSEYEEGKK